ncbi:MAG TPA: FG-GAP-like repeat-containing protein [Gemmataceae bacterium]|nr:FG-GAP-like repeat-containing protein [Gemmataceae bacterium]
MSASRKTWWIGGSVAALGAIVLVVIVMRPWGPELPEPSSPAYEQYAEAFETGTAAMDADMNNVASENLTKATKIVPREPAAWANRGLLYIRENRLPEATADLNKAHELAPDSPEVDLLLGLLADKKGNYDEAIAHLRRAVERRPQDVAALFQLAHLISQAAGENSDAEYQKLMEAILRVQPNNLKALTERCRVAAQRRDAETVQATLARFDQLAPDWSQMSRDQLAVVKKAAKAMLLGDVPYEVSQLDHVLMAEFGYARYGRELNTYSSGIGEALQQFLRLSPLRTTPDPPDTGLTFTPRTIDNVVPDVAKERWDLCLPVWLSGESAPAVFVANAKTVRRADGPAPVLSFPSGAQHLPPTANGILPVDWNNDTLNDLLLAGVGGLKFWQQDKDGGFSDVTAKTGLAPPILNADYFGVWAADIEMDGDLDVIAAPRSGEPIILRNNQDGTFKVVKPFAGVDGARAFIWADFDNDGAPDAAFIDKNGQLHVFANERAGVFRRRPVPSDLGRLVALAAADVNDDGVIDLLAVRDDGAVLRLSDQKHGQGWQVAEIARWPDFKDPIEPGAARIFVADFDNNGMPDLVVVGPRNSRVFLGEGPDKFTPLATEIASRITGVEDVLGKGKIDLLTVSDPGQPVQLIGKSTKDYHWQLVRPFANANAPGDQRINSYGIGSEIELRAGTLVQKQIISSPRVHFGLGHRSKGQVLRIVWTSGYAQYEFLDAGDNMCSAKQRLKGSCPFLFTWDGKQVTFVTDFLWSSPLGMYINGQAQTGFAQTQDWCKVRSEQLAPHNGFYDLRVQANLWETHFIDYVALMVVDHPANTEIFVDERFALTPMKLDVHLTSKPKPVARAIDDNGSDVTEIVKSVDGVYLDTFGRGKFQGITRDHWVEVDLGANAPIQGPLWLLATGWIHPTDSSINMAINQGNLDKPQPLVLEVPDGHGGWKASGPALGFPAGKNKTMMIRLDGSDGKEVARHFRLRTNLEIYWDALQYAVGLDSKDMKQQRLSPEKAELRYRGILEMTQANASSPELPHYDRIATTQQRWRDLIGYHTRFGDVKELLANVDDRYVIMNAGDELALRFPVPAGPPAGWKRDFVWVGDGWEKDGDFNTSFSKTVLPLPAHNLKSYDRPPGRLEDDPVYQRNPMDWCIYHTRYVTPYEFEQGLRSFRRPQP